MRKTILVVIGVLILGYVTAGLIFGETDFYKFWQRLTAANNVKVLNLKCHQPWDSRAGFCTFRMEANELDALVKKLEIPRMNPVTQPSTPAKDSQVVEMKIIVDVRNMVQNFGCMDNSDFNHSTQASIELYTKRDDPKLHDQVKNVRFHALFYNREQKSGCVQLEYPYG